MTNHKRSINSIIHDQLIGQISEEDSIELQTWLESSLENQKKYTQLLHEAGLMDRYHVYAQIDEERTWKQFREKHFAPRRPIWKKAMQYAALFILPIIGLAALWWWNTPDSKPVISHETRVAMVRSERMGKQKAILVLPDGKKVTLRTTSSAPIQRPLAENTVPATAPTETGQTEAKSDKDNKLITYRDSEFWVTFEDGTRVHLNYNTTLKYPSHFSAATRTVYLDGEAYFEVAKDKRPFLVVTKDGIVQQYGTSFNVNTQGEVDTKVVLVEGAISVLSDQGKEFMMKPGELALLRAKVEEVKICKVDIEPYIAWNKGRFVFDNCSLEVLMNVISGWYGKNVLFESEEIRYMRFTGDMDRYESITPVAKAIQRVTGLQIEVTEKDILLKNYNTNN